MTPHAPVPGRPPTGNAIPGAGQNDVCSGSRISVRDFPGDPGRSGRRVVTSRRAARRGHGPRGPILPPEVPRWRSRAAEFDAAALEAFAEIDQHWHSRLVHLDLAVDMVPRMRLKPGETWPEEVVADGLVPLARLVPAGVDRAGQPTRARLVLFRRPLTRRAPGGDDLRDLVYSVLVELVSQHLEISPDEVEAGPNEN
ncbi:putative Zn-dependent protease with MMP-like domain [Dietzia sp. 2505]